MPNMMNDFEAMQQQIEEKLASRWADTVLERTRERRALHYWRRFIAQPSVNMALGLGFLTPRGWSKHVSRMTVPLQEGGEVLGVTFESADWEYVACPSAHDAEDGSVQFWRTSLDKPHTCVDVPATEWWKMFFARIKEECSLVL